MQNVELKKEKNIWFYVAGVISAVVSGLMYFGTLVAIILAVVASSTDGIDEVTGAIPDEGTSILAFTFGITILLIFVFLFVAIMNTICAKKFLDLSKLDRETLEKEKTSAIIVIVLAFLFCGTITGIVGLIGLIYKTEIATTQNQQKTDVSVKLENAKKLYEDGVISDEEYQKMRENILKEI